jgi:hypothetical protein
LFEKRDLDILQIKKKPLSFRLKADTGIWENAGNPLVKRMKSVIFACKNLK